MHGKTAIAEAFRKVGVTGARERLEQEARDAIERSGSNLDLALSLLLGVVRDDAPMLWEMTEEYRERAAKALLTETAAAMRQNGWRHTGSDAHGCGAPSVHPIAAGQIDRDTPREGAGGTGDAFIGVAGTNETRRNGQASGESHAERAPASSHSDPNDRAWGLPQVDARRPAAPGAVNPTSGAGGQASPDTHTIGTAAPLDRKKDGAKVGLLSGDTHTATAGPSRPPARQPRGMAAIASVQDTLQRSLLRTFLVNGRPIGELTGREAREAAASAHQRGRFIELLAHGVPDTMPIADCKTAADAEQAMRIAKECTNA